MSDEKLDRIIQLLEEQRVLLRIRQNEGSIKDEIKEYLMKHYNIKWLNDSIESEMYDVLLGTIWTIIFKE